MALLPKLNPEFFRKYPGAVYYILVFTIAGYFTSQFVTSSNGRNQDCAEERKQDAVQIEALQRRLDKDDSTLTDLYQQLLISHGIIDQLPEKLDSLSRVHKRRK